MLRLLWKEFHEVKWYLLGLLPGPWALTSWGLMQKLPPRGIYGLCFWVCAILLAFWAASRMQKDVQANYLSVHWLPVNRWIAFSAKFLPGLVVVLLMPTWLRFVVTACAGCPLGQGPAYAQDPAGAGILAAIYTCTFAVSMFLPSLAAVLIGLVVVWLPCGFLIIALSGLIEDDVVFSAVAVIAGAICIGAWYRPASAGTKSRLLSAGSGALLGLMPAVALALLMSVHHAGGVKQFRAFYDIYKAMHSPTANRSTEPYAYSGPAVSPDGRYIADVNVGPQGARLEIMDARGGRIRVSDDRTASPAAWLRTGDLLFYTGAVGRTLHLNHFNLRNGRVESLASFPPGRGMLARIRPILTAMPDQSGDRVALVVVPQGGEFYPDLWVLDTRTRALRMLRPGLVTARQGSYITWNSDSVVIARSGEYWRIPLDGSRPVRITDSRKEAQDD